VQLVGPYQPVEGFPMMQTCPIWHRKYLPKEPDWVVSMIPDLPLPKSWNENVDAQCLVSMASTETGFIGPSATSGRKHIHAMDTKIYLHQKWLNDSSISSLGNIKATAKNCLF